jgi:FKBP-type peptidyl-prolyl cis-trans isomerase 2
MAVEDGKTVSIEFTLETREGEVAFSNVGQEPVTYRQGAGEILPGIEDALAGMETGDTKEVELAPEQAFGRVDPELFRTVEAAAVPADARRPGAELVAHTKDGRERRVRVRDVEGEDVVIDMNHPLAGRDVKVSVTVLKVE